MSRRAVQHVVSVGVGIVGACALLALVLALVGALTVPVNIAITAVAGVSWLAAFTVWLFWG